MGRGANLGTLALAAWTVNATAASSPVRIPRGVADLEARTGYVVGATGSIEALALASGKVVWTTTSADTPLLTHGRYLVAQRTLGDRALRILLLDTSKHGALALESEVVSFPEPFSVRPGLGRSFTSQVRIAGGQLFLQWTAQVLYAGGMAPTAEEERQGARSAAGVVRVDLATGQAKAVASDEYPREPEPRSDLQPVRDLPIVAHRGRATTPVTIDEVIASLAWGDRDARRTFVLLRWERSTGRALAPMTLLTTAGSANATVTLDERHVLIRSGPQDAPLLFSLANGARRLAMKPEPVIQHRDVTVLGDRVYYLAQSSDGGANVEAVELVSGRMLWRHAVRAEPEIVALP